MDPFSHALLGASAAHFAFGRRLPRRAWLIGAGAGLAPDLDFFIRSASDPLLNIELHRQFTHALAFIPMGGALSGLPWLLRRRARAEWRDIPVLVVTAKDLTAAERTRLNGDVERVLQKGSSELDEMLQEISRVLPGSIARGHGKKVVEATV